MTPTVIDRLTALTERADRLVAHAEIADAKRELRLARERDPAAARAAIIAARDEARAERLDAERQARRRAIARVDSLDLAGVIARDS